MVTQKCPVMNTPLSAPIKRLIAQHSNPACACRQPSFDFTGNLARIAPHTSIGIKDNHNSSLKE
ncbi:MAG: hypothetical protein M1510_06960 [Nitrospirae bacterium]|nr:hypothetical protein [Nitrospirota bacterium]